MFEHVSNTGVAAAAGVGEVVKRNRITWFENIYIKTAVSKFSFLLPPARVFWKALNVL